jgi:hypothetical protein
MFRVASHEQTPQIKQEFIHDLHDRLPALERLEDFEAQMGTD